MSRYRVPSQPTTYRGVTFRSRLEARWAHLFDQIGVPWEYEPKVRMRGWLPDFRLWGRFLVEVKPVSPDGFGMAYTEFDFFQKAIRSVETILLGNGPGCNFGAIVSADDDRGIGARTFFYDPSEPFLMRSVGGDGASDPCSGNLTWHWFRACSEIGGADVSEAQVWRKALRDDRPIPNDLLQNQTNPGGSADD